MPSVPEGSPPDTVASTVPRAEEDDFAPPALRSNGRLPRVAEACAVLTRAIVIGPGALERVRKEEILLATAAARRDAVLAQWHRQTLEALGAGTAEIGAILRGFPVGPEPRAALLAFSRTLCLQPASIAASDLEALRELDFSDEQLLEAVLTAGLSEFLGTLGAGLRTESGPPAPDLPDSPPAAPRPSPAAPGTGPYLRAIDRAPEEFLPFGFLRDAFGFVPRLFRAQTLRPAAIEAEVQATRDLLIAGDVLTRRQKQIVALAVSAVQRNTYGVTLHSATLRTVGVSTELSDRIVAGVEDPGLPEAERALLAAARRLALRSGNWSEENVEALRGQGFRDDHILEIVATVAFTGFLNTLQAGLGPKPDFRPRHDFRAEAESLNPSAPADRPTIHDQGAPGRAPDPDAAEVARAREGDMSAFETLVRRHQGRVYRTLAGVTGSADEAEDGTQAVFVKVFRKIGDFGGNSLFSTWLTRIAINEGLERLRSRRSMESLEDRDEADFRPTRLQPWMDDPETRCARQEMRRLVEDALARLPAPYRVAVMLRDIDQLSTAEAAAATGVPLATLKTRLLRGRLMLREILAARFERPAGTTPAGDRRV